MKLPKFDHTTDQVKLWHTCGTEHLPKSAEKPRAICHSAAKLLIKSAIFTGKIGLLADESHNFGRQDIPEPFPSFPSSLLEPYMKAASLLVKPCESHVFAGEIYEKRGSPGLTDVVHRGRIRTSRASRGPSRTRSASCAASWARPRRCRSGTSSAWLLGDRQTRLFYSVVNGETWMTYGS